MHLGHGEEILRCQQCTLLVRIPIPPEETITGWYRDVYWNHYRDEPLRSKRSNVYIHAMAWIEQLHPKPGILVDVGCGSGAFLALCQKRGWMGLGFDPSTQAVTLARALGLEVRCSSFLPCNLADETTDVVTFINVLDHLRNPIGALQEAWRILRPNGLIYIRVPNGPFHVWLMSLWSAVELRHMAVFHLFGFGRSAFLYHLSRLGFEVAEIRTAPPSSDDSFAQLGPRMALFGRSLKVAGHLAYQLLVGLGLDRKAWGPSIEVIAFKAHPNSST
ncbi:class I SAM-dependent methyltransferase [Candidatus Methylomirabilis sp.]|uniref:class I SAM-dependent methyltransferase n=1 Tax=Candidatus Methylomirabilis sp. TaxID=2032687 RepID=UPI002A67803D|nr:class I SAM-dependent methyltransferase [Candidatus Methylomirabilis sp.]